MNRPWTVAAAFGACLVVGALAVAWLSVQVLRLNRAEAEARAQAAFEEDVRLALWRLDSAVAPIFARESARPYFAYSSFYPAERAYTRMYAEIGRGEVLIPSRLLTEKPQFVLLHFQFAPDGKLASPQAPTGNMCDVAEGKGFVSKRQVDAATAKLKTLGERIRREDLLSRLPPLEIVAEAPSALATAAPPPVQAETPLRQEPGVDRFSQATRSTREFAYRASQNRNFLNPEKPSGQSLLNAEPGAIGGGRAAQAEDRPAPKAQAALNFDNQAAPQFENPEDEAAWLMRIRPEGPPPHIVEDVFHPLWVKDELIAARRVAVGSDEYIQGFSLDWPSLREWLAKQVDDLLPGARLEPVPELASTDNRRMLAALPVRLSPGPLGRLAMEGVTAFHLSLTAAWMGMGVAVVAVAMLLRGAVALGERRGAFVSSVTHELRTPLTTFRMYTEMLADGMVPTEAARRRYLETLRAEADRLAHLVENVLAYARLERGRDGGRVESVVLGALLARLDERFLQRTREAGMEWERDRKTPLLGIPVLVDPIALEQILFNLVDNACKYAAGAADRRIELTLTRAAPRAKAIVLRVRDFGPGVSAAGLNRVFRLFRKSATDAAHSAPGVGLGLALSRRLARKMGGNLRLCEPALYPGPGACFALTIPIV